MEKGNQKKIAFAAVIVMFSIILSRLAGYLRDTMLVNYFTGRLITDSYNMAFRVTDTVTNLMLGIVAAALIPFLTSCIAKNDEEEGWKATSTFMNLNIVLLLLICTFGMIFTPDILPLFAYGYTGEKFELTVELIRILLPSVMFTMLAGMVNGVLNSHQRFAVAAMGPLIYNTGSILSILFFNKYGVHTVMYGIMFSAFTYFAINFCFALKHFKYYRPRFWFKHAGFLSIMMLAVPSFISSIIVQVNSVVTSNFSSGFSDGSVTALRMADRIWQLPYSIFAMSIGIAMLPTLTASYSNKQVEECRNIFSRALNTVLYIIIPAAVGLIVLRSDIVRLLFQLGDNVTDSDVSMASSILFFFSFALIAQCVLQIVSRGFYSIQDTITPLCSGAIAVIVNITLCFYLKDSGLEASGTALAYAVATFVNASILLVIFNFKMQGIHIKRLLVFLTKTMISAIFMGIAITVIGMYMPVDTHSKLNQIIAAGLEIGAGILMYLVCTYLLKVEELYYVLEMVMKKIPFLRGKVSVIKR